MDWKDLGGALIGMGARTLGTLIAGPMGGAIGGMLADKLGTAATPDAVNDALGNNPAAAAVVASAEVEWAKTAAVVAQEGTKQGQAINETIRAEIASGVSPWHWRHLLGYVFGLWCLAPLPLLLRDLWLGNTVNINSGIQLATALFPFFATIAAILGYVANDTTKLRTAAVTGQQPDAGLVGSLIKGLTGKLAR